MIDKCDRVGGGKVDERTEEVGIILDIIFFVHEE
jgi:hypothetical protein